MGRPKKKPLLDEEKIILKNIRRACAEFVEQHGKYRLERENTLPHALLSLKVAMGYLDTKKKLIASNLPDENNFQKMFEVDV